MKVDVLGPVAVSSVAIASIAADSIVADSADVGSAGGRVEGRALGGRRARVALVALALAGGHVPADRLAAMIWGEELPPTWPAALRGVIRGLRTACAPAGGGDQRLIVTAPAGYRLAGSVEVDVDRAVADVRRAAVLLGEGRLQSAADLAEPVAGLAGSQLLPGEDADWLSPHRARVDALALRAALLLAEAAGLLGQHDRAVECARRAVAAQPLDEGAHRALITALDRSGDRSGAVRAYEQCRVMLGEQLGVDPSAETVEVYLRALGDQTAGSAARVPVRASSFVGREAELAALAGLAGSAGLVTVTGRGGVGKSRLAMRVAAGFAGGRWWVPLAAVADDALVASGVALALGVPFGAEDPALAVAEHLAPLGRALLVLDGCEAVVDGAATLAAALLARAPMLTVLATGRLPLAVDGERVFDVGPLPPPDAGPGLGGSGQVRLLVDRVREAGGDLVVDDDVAPHLIELCRRCGGLPLALELVAAQLTAMPAGDLLDHLDQAGPTGRDELRAIAYSGYLLLEDDEATVFRRMAVLDGPVGLPLVREVVSGGPISSIRVVRILRELTARGLLAVDRSGQRWRYQQDDDLRRFAGELLAEQGEERARGAGGEERALHARLADAIRSRLPQDARAAPAPYREEITDLLGSIRSLFGAGLVGRADLERCRELAFRLHRYFATTNIDEGRFWLSRLLGAGPPGEWTPYATYALGYLSYWSGDTEDAMRDLESAVRMLEGGPDTYRARALIFLAGLLDDVDRGAEAIEHVRLSVEAAAPFDVDLQCSAAMGMGSVLAERVDPDAARYARDAIELCRRGGSAEQLALAMPTAAMICWQVGALEESREYIAEALPMHAGAARIARVVLLSAAAGVALADGDLDAAVEFGRAADEGATELGVEREAPLIRAVLARALLARDDLAAAARCSAGALDAGLAGSTGFPLAVGLETAALVLHAAGAANAGELGEILAAAAAVRRRGDRPAPATLARAVGDLLAVLGLHCDAADAPDPRAAARRALDLLGRVRVGVEGGDGDGIGV